MHKVNNKKIGFMKVLGLLSFFFTIVNQPVFSQNPEGFKEIAINMADKSVPIIALHQIDKIKDKGKEIIYIDARELEEYKVSHIKNAVHVGYDNFQKEKVSKLDKKAIYIVYCSVGYRSGKIGKKMQEMGFKFVFNLYGGLFNWANNNRPMVNSETETTKVHPFNKKWGKWLKKELWEGI